MKYILIGLPLCFFLLSSNAFSQATYIYIVRHAEKDSSSKDKKDPDLSMAGQVRARTLDRILEDIRLSAVFTTNYKRMLQTIEPITARTGLNAIFYNPLELSLLSQKIKNEFAGLSVLIVGHSNTILPTIRALGGKSIHSEIKDDQYDLMFKLIIDQNSVQTYELTYRPVIVNEVPSP